MKNIWEITLFTLREALAKKVFLFFLIISGVVIFALALVSGFIDSSSILMTFSAGGEQVMGDVITTFEMMIINPLANLCLLLAVFSSASFVPVMLEKGNIDLFLSKPISRSQLLWGKYFGGILVVLLNIAFLIIGVWFIISLKFSFWNFSVLWTILLITLAFAALNSIIVLLGVITRSSVIGMMTAYFIYLILSPLLLAAKERSFPFVTSDFVNTLLDGLYYIIPKTTEILGTNIFTVASGLEFNYQPVISSVIFLLITMIAGVEIFKRKDY